MSVIKNIVRSGLLDSDPYSKKRGILLSNYVSLILIIGATSLFILRTIFFKANTYALSFDFLLEAIILFIVPIILNRFSFPTVGRLFLCYASVLFIWHVFIIRLASMEVIESTMYDTLRIFMLAISPIPFLIFDKNRNPLLLLAILPTLISVVFTEWILSLANVSHAQRGIPGIDYELMQMRTSIAYFIICGTCYSFHIIITRNDKFNQKILTRLKQKSNEVHDQNKQLVESQRKLNELNQNLENLVEQKTVSIKKQNEQLRKYTFANAHEVRGPVARLLGLIQLSEIKADLQYPWLFEKIKDETESLDIIIKGLTKELDNLNTAE